MTDRAPGYRSLALAFQAAALRRLTAGQPLDHGVLIVRARLDDDIGLSLNFIVEPARDGPYFGLSLWRGTVRADAGMLVRNTIARSPPTLAAIARAIARLRRDADHGDRIDASLREGAWRILP